jgi:hypothetical protein
MTTPWWDIEMRGRRLEALSKRMTTEFYKAINQGEWEIALSFIDRVNKTEVSIKPYVEQITGLKKLLKDNDEVSIGFKPSIYGK